MNEPLRPARIESRWPPAIVLVVLLVLLNALPGHVVFLPIWLGHACMIAVLSVMAGVQLTRGNVRWLRAERWLTLFLGAVYVANTVAELADMVGIITIHPSGTNAFALLSSAVGIWLANVGIFALVFWQVDGGGPYGRARQPSREWGFPVPPDTQEGASGWAPEYLDYFFLAYNTATAFSPTDVMPYSRRAKALMTLESAISLVTLVVVLSRAINVLPT